MAQTELKKLIPIFKCFIKQILLKYRVRTSPGVQIKLSLTMCLFG